MIGGGNGIERLRAAAKQYGVEDKLVFTGYVELDHLAEHLNAIDVCLSTQSNDVPGRVRTTGKLPLYLATGRFVLASRVGEASLVLPEEMLVPYEGVRDDAYPGRLAERIRWALANPDAVAAARKIALGIAWRFDYDALAERVAEAIEGTLAGRRSAHAR
jgi:glycosyltransferase involved in cell wall biosynthesis